MSMLVPFVLVNLYCRVFDCEGSLQAPYFSTLQRRTFAPSILPENEVFIERLGRSYNSKFPEHPVVMTNSGAVQGYTMTISPTRKIYAFQGVPYGESPIPFSNPEKRRPWKGILQAQSESQYCIQQGPGTLFMVTGQEDCLLVDVYTPRKGDGGTNSTKFPVIFWIAGGFNQFGRSRVYGPANFLREDVILVVPNFRMGIYGWATTGDAHFPGNWAMKDLALAIEWVHENIEQFGGDKTKIVVGGISSGAVAAHMMLYTRYKIREYISGVFAVSGFPFANGLLDPDGELVIEATKIAARQFGCVQNQSREMMDCLRRVDPYMVLARQTVVAFAIPNLSHTWRAVVEPDHPTAFISELPEVSYENGRVSKVPLIVSRNVDEFAPFGLAPRQIWPLIRQYWFQWTGKLLKLGYRRYPIVEKGATPTEQRRSLEALNKIYFNTTNPPIQMRSSRNFKSFIDMMSDALYNAPLWKAIKLHHKVAPTYAYINKQETRRHILGPISDVVVSLSIDNNFGSIHTSGVPLLFNTSRMIRFEEGSEEKTASNNLVNMIANFAKYGKPLYRAGNGDLVEAWKPIEDMREPRVLEVGLVRDIRMIRDPLVGTRRLQIWDEVRF